MGKTGGGGKNENVARHRVVKPSCVWLVKEQQGSRKERRRRTSSRWRDVRKHQIVWLQEE